MEEKFARLLLKIYDKKMMSGEITFSRSGITKEDFTNLCMNGDFVLSYEKTEHICDCMNIVGEERAKLLSFCEEQ
ncbi:MAG: hypothetical protein IJU59_00385 [Firmicutes bacterium]|nr:hypothetical protein [Bacillota bacterium]